MAGPASRGIAAAWVPAACLLIAFAVLPLVVVAVAPGVDNEASVCRVEVRSRLAETMEGKLEFLLVDALEGRPPADRFVITIDHGYVAGVPDHPGQGPGPEPAETSETAPGRVF